MGKMLVYHGSYTEIRQPEIRKGRNTKDFGNGFYCTVIKEQAQRWAKRYRSSVVNVYSAWRDLSIRLIRLIFVQKGLCNVYGLNIARKW